MRLGAIADDITGATDLASVLRRAGLRVVQTLGVPDGPAPDADAVVVSLKTRTAPVRDATAAALAAADYLLGAGAPRLYFKYCSTFDSTETGNIGPVIDALLERLGTTCTIACPAYPALARTVYAGHLFVGDQLLSDSSMRHHPLTPMSDPNLVRVLGRQSRARVGLVPLRDVEAGVDATRAALAALSAGGPAVAIADAVFDRHLRTLAEAVSDLPLVTGGAALGGAVAASGGDLTRDPFSEPPLQVPAPVAILSGSCSAATLVQVERVSGLVPRRTLDPRALAGDPGELPRIVDWACEQARRGSVLVASTDRPAAVQGIQAALGRDAAATLVEAAFRAIAVALAAAGVRTFVVAGGETSGAVLDALRVRMLTFHDEHAPGVPWVTSVDPEGFVFALKSGNFGGPEFFRQALQRAAGEVQHLARTTDASSGESA